MVTRVYIDGNEPRIICSRQGYEASPSLLDQNKTFDSNWFYGGGIRWILNENLPIGQNTFTPFPVALSYKPRVDTFFTIQWFGDNNVFAGTIHNVSDWNPPHGGWVLHSGVEESIGVVSSSGISGTVAVYGGGRRISVVYGD